MTPSTRSTLPDPVDLTRTLVRINTLPPGGLESRCIEPLADLLSAAGYQCRVVDMAPGRGTLVARIGGRPDRAPIAFTGHVDVVPLGSAGWTQDPWGADVVDGRLYGRGSSDMKSGVAAFTVAALACADMARDGAGITLIITAGEETGCDGAFHLARQPEARQWVGQAGALVVAEPTANAPLRGHKGAFWLKALAQGKTAHGSMPHLGDNAIYKLARAALALEKHDFETPPHPEMGSPSLTVSTIKGGININSVPDAAEMTVDIRTVAGMPHAQVLRCLCATAGGEVRLEPLLDLEAVYTGPQDPWMQRVQALTGETSARHPALPIEPARAAVASYFTDAAALRPLLGMPPTVILGPGEPSQAHQTDEYCVVDRIPQAQQLFEALVADWHAA